MYTSIPIDSAIICTGTHLRKFKNNELEIQEMLKLLRYCLSNKLLQFEDGYYIENHHLAMGSPLSPILSDIIMNHFETPITTMHKNRLGIIVMSTIPWCYKYRKNKSLASWIE